MRIFSVVVLLSVITAGAPPLRAAEVKFESGPGRTHLLELFTSEGCSSCPPAEKWLSDLKANARLWKDFVPVAFHVDYWDRLGWPDRFASKAFTARQQAYAAAWRSGSVYTPAFVLDGREWRERAADKLTQGDETSGTLHVQMRDGTLHATYRPSATSRDWELHVALLGLEVQSRVQAGENRGRDLRHDFVVLSHQQTPMASAAGGSFHAETVVPLDSTAKKALAVWVTEAGKLAPMQATGGPL